MTVGKQPLKRVIVVPGDFGGRIKTLSVPHPSNTSNKAPLELFIHGNELFHLEKQAFSRGCSLHKARDAESNKYNYTNDGSPLKSTFVVNTQDRTDALVLETGTFEFSTKFDLAFSLCGALLPDSRAAKETEYVPHANDYENVTLINRFLTPRDFQDALAETQGAHWSFFPLSMLEAALQRICEHVEEAGDVYYKLSPVKVTQWLVDKVKRIVANFPASLPIPKTLPEDILDKAKVYFACNLLVSLVPRAAYHLLIQYDGPDLDVSEAFRAYKQHMEVVVAQQKEQQILINAAMNVGLSNRSTEGKKPLKVRKVTAVKKVVVKKGAIDGFFKKKK
ncbi:LAMI_0D03708g1_1 [Lachancea mirantina]|uniref:Ribonuclease H2 subunit B n=1 Tax=Lachancea mirantina TaxID=1230905 RepID=A0A1G4J9W7_9SACH|nr:LAMI_0D03708g1_1 [Lachancea mirantina]